MWMMDLRTEDAIQLLKQAKSEGVNEIIATPHHLSPVLIMSVKSFK